MCDCDKSDKYKENSENDDGSWSGYQPGNPLCGDSKEVFEEMEENGLVREYMLKNWTIDVLKECVKAADDMELDLGEIFGIYTSIVTELMMVLEKMLNAELHIRGKSERLTVAPIVSLIHGIISSSIDIANGETSGDEIRQKAIEEIKRKMGVSSMPDYDGDDSPSKDNPMYG